MKFLGRRYPRARALAACSRLLIPSTRPLVSVESKLFRILCQCGFSFSKIFQRLRPSRENFCAGLRSDKPSKLFASATRRAPANGGFQTPSPAKPVGSPSKIFLLPGTRPLPENRLRRSVGRCEPRKPLTGTQAYPQPRSSLTSSHSASDAILAPISPTSRRHPPPTAPASHQSHHAASRAPPRPAPGSSSRYPLSGSPAGRCRSAPRTPAPASPRR